MRIDPDRTAVRLAQTRERAERDGVVTAEDDRHEPCARVVRDELSDSLARRLDLRKEASVLVPTEVASATAVSTFPQSTTSWPSSAIREASPA